MGENRPTIVVLDGYTLNPGDLSWVALKELGNVTIYDKTPQELIVERSKDCEIIFTNKTPLSDADFAQLPKLKYIGVLATGYNVVDTAAATKHNITVTNIPTYGTASVAQFVFANILYFCHHLEHHSHAVHSGKWAAQEHFCFWDYPLTELDGKTIGIVGFGRIGQRVAEIAEAFNMKILAYDTYKPEISTYRNLKWVAIEELFKQSDFVSLHCPLTPKTQGIVDAKLLSLMKPTAFLINTSRGPLVDEQALADVLNYSKIAGAALDVVAIEPIVDSNPLLHAKNCIITPHIAWATKEARARLMDIAVNNLVAFLNGNAVNTVN